MLIVVKNRDAQTFFKPGFDFKTFRCLDVFQINATECRFQRGNNINQAIGIFFFNFDIELTDRDFDKNSLKRAR